MMSGGLMSAWKRGGAAAGWSIPWGTFTFSRASEASYLTAAPGTGATAFMAWASSNALREEDRGDGAGPLALFEGERTNVITRSQEIDDVAWTTAGTVTVTAGQDGPDGTTAERLQASSGTNIRYQTKSIASGYQSLSGWVRAASGTVDHSLYIFDGTTVFYIAQSGITTTYRRIIRTVTAAAGSGNVAAVDARSGGGISAGSRDAYVALMQVEAGKFPTSAIRCGATTVSRLADEATMTSGIPAGLFSGRGQFAQFSPVYASSDLVFGDVAWLLSIDGADDGIRVYHDGTDCYVQVLEAGVVVAESQPLSWSAHDLVGAILWDPAAGLIYVDGVAGPAGTPWSWAAGSIRVGGIYGTSGSEAFARVGALGSA